MVIKARSVTTTVVAVVWAVRHEPTERQATDQSSCNGDPVVTPPMAVMSVSSAVAATAIVAAPIAKTTIPISATVAAIVPVASAMAAIKPMSSAMAAMMALSLGRTRNGHEAADERDRHSVPSSPYQDEP